MTVEIRPLGVRCNLQCQYCYQHPQRNAANVPGSYDLEKIKSKLKKQGCHFSLFGGEALLVPENNLEHLWAWGLKRFGQNGIQTNGTLINDSHVRMFKQYKVHVGISVDGPGELNDVRWCGSLEATRAATAKTQTAIERLCKEGIPPSIIVTLHRNNATADKLPVMHAWFKRLSGLGVAHARLHFLEVNHDGVGKKYALSEDENVEALFSFAKMEKKLPGLRVDLFNDFRNMLLGRDNTTTCTWTGCDPYTTRAVHGIEGDGQSSNCGRTNKDGVELHEGVPCGIRALSGPLPYAPGIWRVQGLPLLPHVQRPMPGHRHGWRLAKPKRQLCGVWMRVFERFEEEYLDQGVVPLSISPKRPKVERILLDHWTSGQLCHVNQALQMVDRQPAVNGDGPTTLSQRKGGGHGDHSDHGDSAGGKQAHGDGAPAPTRAAMTTFLTPTTPIPLAGRRQMEKDNRLRAGSKWNRASVNENEHGQCSKSSFSEGADDYGNEAHSKCGSGTLVGRSVKRTVEGGSREDVLPSRPASMVAPLGRCGRDGSPAVDSPWPARRFVHRYSLRRWWSLRRCSPR